MFLGSSSQKQIEAPIAQRQGEPTQKFGIELLDPYAWLRDQDWHRVMRDPSALANEIRSYLDAENKWAQQALEPVEELRETLTNCLLYTSPSPRDLSTSRMPSSA